ncbi:MAG: D-2-hydroxyacid dehydrogenase [Alicyclobacillus sp.]|nr:D-2-hydroxyacid dehydrogenase [Alicyclobacillus sp.]
MPTILCLRSLTAAQLHRIEAAAPGWTVIVGQEAEQESWLPHVAAAEILAGWSRQAEHALKSAPETALRWVQNWGAGVDTLPLAFFQERGIQLTNASGVHAYPIAETVLAMMLGLTRKIHTYVRNQQAHKWHHAHLSQEMHGRTVTILGIGAIGSEVARLCQAFGMRVLGVRRSARPHSGIDQMFSLTELTSAVAESDYIVNTLPLTPETRGVVSQQVIAAMKPTAFYINIGRGATTDEAALITALAEGRLAGAGLDVFLTEPLPADSPLWDMENVILTPHTSGSTEHYNERALDIFLENLHAYVRGQALVRNVVDLERAY